VKGGTLELERRERASEPTNLFSPNHVWLPSSLSLLFPLGAADGRRQQRRHLLLHLSRGIAGALGHTNGHSDELLRPTPLPPPQQVEGGRRRRRRRRRRTKRRRWSPKTRRRFPAPFSPTSQRGVCPPESLQLARLVVSHAHLSPKPFILGGVGPGGKEEERRI
jgi:hypothetical protein